MQVSRGYHKRRGFKSIVDSVSWKEFLYVFIHTMTVYTILEKEIVFTLPSSASTLKTFWNKMNDVL